MQARTHPAIAARLARLAPDQRAAATAAPGPVLCVAPAGSGKTTTLVARVAWRVGGGTPPGSVTVVAFNRRAAEDLAARLDGALEPLGLPPGSVRVRTFHALGREILGEAGRSVEPLVDRGGLLRALFPELVRADRGRLDLAFSRLKLDLRVGADAVAADPSPGPVARAFIAYERAVRDSGGLDFDDLLVRSLAALDGDPALLARWRNRTRVLLVDEAQDLDRTQLDLVLRLAAPANDVFLVGDDDQTVYAWRLADVRRVLGLAASLPGLRRVDLATNYRCPPPVVERAVRLVEHNRERFDKRIVAGSLAGGQLVLAPDAADETVRIGRAMASWPGDASTRAVLARTNRELLAAVVAALDLGLPFRAPDLPLLLEDPRLDALLDEADEGATGAGAETGAVPGGSPRSLPALGRLRARLRAADRARSGDPGSDGPGGDGAGGAKSLGAHPRDSVVAESEDGPSSADLVTALLGWAAAHPTVAHLRAAIAARRDRLADLRRDDALLSLATAHGTKGLEWDHVVVLADGFPARRSISEAAEPDRALEEERRLAYVAWTRARRSLTLLYDPDAPPPFLREAFDPGELGAPGAPVARTPGPGR